MKKSVNKILIIVLIVVSVLAVIGGIFAYLFFATDIFKSNQQLFAKSLIQNFEELNQIIPLNSIEKIEEKLQKNKYEENTTISINQSGRFTSSSTITIDTQNDYINKKTYSNIILSTENIEKDLQFEYMRESNLYSLRFTNSVKQFLSVENKSLKQLAVNMGFDEETIEMIPDTIDFEKFSLKRLKPTQEEINTEISKYGTLIYNNIPKENYTKNKDVVITVNGKTLTTNSYVLTLTAQDVKALTIKILEAFKQDEIILAKLDIIDEMIKEYTEENIKSDFIEAIQEKIDELNNEEITNTENLIITIYEENGHTIRAKLEQGTDTVTFDTIETNGQTQVILTETSLDQDNTQISNILTFVKESDTKASIQFSNLNGEEQKSYKINFELVETENNIKLDITIASAEIEIKFTRNINFVDEIKYKVTLDNTNDIILNDLTEDQMSYIFSAVSNKITKDYIEKLPILDLINIWKNNKETDLAIESSNSKFQIYEGIQTTNNINELLDIVCAHNKQQQTSEDPHYVIVSGEVILKADETDYEKLDGDKYYTVVCKKDEESELISEIVVTIKENSENVNNDNNSETIDTEEDVLNSLNPLN